MPDKTLSTGFAEVGVEEQCSESFQRQNLFSQFEVKLLSRSNSLASYYTNRISTEAFSRLSETVIARKWAPRSIVKLNDSYLIPGVSSLYDSNRERILENCVRRGPGSSELIDA
jgi:hypothetical protein